MRRSSCVPACEAQPRQQAAGVVLLVFGVRVRFEEHAPGGFRVPEHRVQERLTCLPAGRVEVVRGRLEGELSFPETAALQRSRSFLRERASKSAGVCASFSRSTSCRSMYRASLRIIRRRMCWLPYRTRMRLFSCGTAQSSTGKLSSVPVSALLRNPPAGHQPFNQHRPERRSSASSSSRGLPSLLDRQAADPVGAGRHAQVDRGSRSCLKSPAPSPGRSAGSSGRPLLDPSVRFGSDIRLNR